MRASLIVLTVLTPRLLLADFRVEWVGTVTEVIDGNSLVISNETSLTRRSGPLYTITLDSMRAPSTNESWGIEAREALAEWSKGKRVKVLQTLDMGKIYGTWVIRQDDGQIVNLQMIQAGFAVATNRHGYAPREMQRYQTPVDRTMSAAEAEARRQGKGMWRKP